MDYFDDIIPTSPTERPRRDSSRHIGYTWSSDVLTLPTRQKSRPRTSSTEANVSHSIVLDNSYDPRSPVVPRSPASRSGRSRPSSRYYESDFDVELEMPRHERQRSRRRRADGSRSPSLDKDMIAMERLELERERELLRRERELEERRLRIREREMQREREIEERRLMIREREMQREVEERIKQMEELSRLMQRDKMPKSEGEAKEGIDLESNKLPETHERKTNWRQPAIPEESEGLESQGEDSKPKSPEERKEREEREKRLGMAEPAMQGEPLRKRKEAEERVRKEAIEEYELRRKAEMEAMERARKKAEMEAERAFEEYKHIQKEMELKARKEKEKADRLSEEKLKAELRGAGYSEEDIESILKDSNPETENKTVQEREKEDTLLEERMKAQFLEAGYTAERIEQTLKDIMKARRRKVEGLSDSTRPTYIKVNQKHLLPETLDEYGLPWEWDHKDPHYIIIKCWVPREKQDELFAHTRAIKERTNLSFEPGGKADREKLYIVRKRTPSGRSRAPLWFV